VPARFGHCEFLDMQTANMQLAYSHALQACSADYQATNRDTAKRQRTDRKRANRECAKRLCTHRRRSTASRLVRSLRFRR
jgi:hypothetical protein